jgi:hypothetical protein
VRGDEAVRGGGRGRGVVAALTGQSADTTVLYEEAESMKTTEEKMPNLRELKAQAIAEGKWTSEAQAAEDRLVAMVDTLSAEDAAKRRLRELGEARSAAVARVDERRATIAGIETTLAEEKGRLAEEEQAVQALDVQASEQGEILAAATARWVAMVAEGQAATS